MARVRAHEHGGPQRLRAAGRRPLSRRAGDAPGGRRAARRRSRDAVERRHGLVRAARARPITLVESGPAAGVIGAARIGGARRAERHLPRHRRHDGEVLADPGRTRRRRPSTARMEPGLRRLPGERAGRRHRRDRRGRRLDRLVRRGRRVVSARRARAPIRARPATAAAAPADGHRRQADRRRDRPRAISSAAGWRSPRAGAEALRLLGEPSARRRGARHGIIRLVDAR